MNNYQNLTVIDGETLMDKRLPPAKFCVESLIPRGLCILGGAPKVGKSWFVLDLCVHIARGEPLWEFPVTKGEVLYFCLEDSERRIQERLNIVTDDVPPGLYFATGNTSIESGLCDFIRKFKQEHPAVTFVAIDTFQLIRAQSSEISYSNDYAELQPLRLLAAELDITLLLVHHLRKTGDKDPVNKLSGSTAIAGAVDAIFVLEKFERIEKAASLYASGRDIRDLTVYLKMNPDNCRWELITDSIKAPEFKLPQEVLGLYSFMKETKTFSGTNTELAKYVGNGISPKGLKQRMNRYRYELEKLPKLLKQYGMRDIRFHDLRHTCASLLVSLDVNMKVIQRYLGHSNMSTTADIYSHLDANATGEAGMKLGKLLADDEEVK